MIELLHMQGRWMDACIHLAENSTENDDDGKIDV